MKLLTKNKFMKDYTKKKMIISRKRTLLTSQKMKRKVNFALSNLILRKDNNC